MALIRLGGADQTHVVALSKAFAILEIEAAKAANAREQRDKERERAHRSEQKQISRALLSQVELVSAPSGWRDARLHLAMQRMEAVHQLPGVLQFRKYKRERIGRMGLNKDAQLLCARGFANSLVPVCEIFRFHAQIHRDDQGRVHLNALHGNVDWMKSVRPTPLEGNEDGTYYYSISNNPLVLMAGNELISNGLPQVTPEGQFETTLSPMRTMQVDHGLPWNVKVQQVLEHIASGKNPVANFHLRNGAFVGWVHFNPSSETDPITVNYIYDRDDLMANQAAFLGGETPDKSNKRIAVSEVLLNALEETQVRVHVAESQKVSPMQYDMAA